MPKIHIGDFFKKITTNEDHIINKILETNRVVSKMGKLVIRNLPSLALKNNDFMVDSVKYCEEQFKYLIIQKFEAMLLRTSCYKTSIAKPDKNSVRSKNNGLIFLRSRDVKMPNKC